MERKGCCNYCFDLLGYPRALKSEKSKEKLKARKGMIFTQNRVRNEVDLFNCQFSNKTLITINYVLISLIVFPALKDNQLLA